MSIIILKLLNFKVIQLPSISISSYRSLSINRIFNTGEGTLHADRGKVKKKKLTSSFRDRTRLFIADGVLGNVRNNLSGSLVRASSK